MQSDISKRIANAERDVEMYTRFVELNKAAGDAAQARHWQHSVFIAKRRVRFLKQLGH